jgi:hypothetical protein
VAQVACELELDHIDMMKLHVEGEEPQVVAGGWPLIARGAIETILLEWNPGSQPTYQRLVDAGYGRFRYDIDHRQLLPAGIDSGATIGTSRAVFKNMLIAKRPPT